MKSLAKLLVVATAMLALLQGALVARAQGDPTVPCSQSRIIGCIETVFDGVEVRYNGEDSFAAYGAYDFGDKWHCVELIQRYYYVRFGYEKKWIYPFTKFNLEEAWQAFDDGYHPSRMTAYNNGSSQRPQSGDVLVFGKGDGWTLGHVALVTQVANARIYFVQQNVRSNFQDSLPIDANNRIGSENRYPDVRGWLHDTARDEFELRQVDSVEPLLPWGIKFVVRSSGSFKLLLDGQAILEGEGTKSTGWQIISGKHSIQFWVQRLQDGQFTYNWWPVEPAFGAETTSAPPTTEPPSVTHKPSLSSPANGSTMPQNTDVTLSWNTSANATQYKVELWGGPYDLMTPCDWQSSITCHIGPMWPGTMSWHVKARQANGQESDWSDTWTFTITESQPTVLPPVCTAPCQCGTGPGGIIAGNYDPTTLTQDQRQWLWMAFGHSGEAPVGYGGEECQAQQTSPQPPICTARCQCGTGPGGIIAGSYDPVPLTQEQRQWLWEAFGHSGEAPVGYGGEPCGESPETSISKIAYVGTDGNIWTMDAEGGEKKKLTNVGVVHSLVWSPDGRQLAFSAWLPGERAGMAIYRINAEGTSLVALTRWDGLHVIAWSPDGTQIAFDTFGAYEWGPCSLYLMNVDGSNRVSLCERLKPYKVALAWTWSPDGTRVAFDNVSYVKICDEGPLCPFPYEPRFDLFILEPDGQFTKLNQTTGSSPYIYPNWSPDGRKIAYTMWDDPTKEGVGASIYVVNVITKVITKLVSDGRYNYSPSWSPDGNKITYASAKPDAVSYGRIYEGVGDESDTAIVVINADGPNPRNVAQGRSPAWSPR